MVRCFLTATFIPLATGCESHSLADIVGFADQYCELADVCCAEASLPTNGNVCRGLFARRAQYDDYNATAGADCIEAIRAAKGDADFCSSFGSAEPCQRVFTMKGVLEGLKLMGARCMEPWDCLPSGVCSALSTDCVDGAFCDSSSGICMPRPAVGEKCFAPDDPCGPSAYCDGLACRALAGVGGDCSSSVAACDADSYCDTTSAKRADWRCKAKLADGAACTAGAQCQCHLCTDGACAEYMPEQQRWLLVCGTR
jgi:hypothetical protein